MPPSTFARNGGPDGGGGFGAVLARLFGAVGKGASDYQDFKKYGPDFRDKQRADEIAQQEAEIGLQQKQAALDYEPIKRRAGELANLERGPAFANALAKMLAQAQQGNEGQTVDAPLPQGGVFDTEVPAGTGPLAVGSAPRPFVPPRLNPDQVAASGMSETDLRGMGEGIYKELKPQRDSAAASLKRELAQAQAAEALRKRLESEKPLTYTDPTTGKEVTLPKQGIAAAISASGAAQRLKDRPAGAGKAGAGDDLDVWAQAISKGDVEPRQIPAAIRGAVLKRAQEQGVEIMNPKQRESVAAFSKVEPIIKGISDLSERINVNQGVMAKLTGGAERAKAQVNLNDDVAEYQALLKGFTPLVARAVGHTGVLTQQDVDSVKEMFPKPGDSKSLRDRKMARLTNILGGVSAATKAGAKRSFSAGRADQTLEPPPAEHGPPVAKRKTASGYEYRDAQGRTWTQ
jgi:hypothetical protein